MTQQRSGRATCPFPSPQVPDFLNKSMIIVSLLSELIFVFFLGSRFVFFFFLYTSRRGSRSLNRRIDRRPDDNKEHFSDHDGLNSEDDRNTRASFPAFFPTSSRTRLRCRAAALLSLAAAPLQCV